MRNFTLYFRPAETIDFKHETIKKVAEKLTHDCTDEVEKAMGRCYFVPAGIHYNFHMVSGALEDSAASTVLARRKGCCVQKVALLAAR
jgi:transglutaminase-like putative cysteine protease